MANSELTCANCNNTAANLKHCAKCKTTRYCGRECQKAHWKTHKKECAKNAAEASAPGIEHSTTYAAPRLNNLDSHVPNPFTRLDKGTYLHDRTQTDLFKLLIDSFRMREADDWDFENKTTPSSVYNRATSSVEPFREYLKKTSTRGLLPSWWSAAKDEECATYGESGAWSNLKKKVTKQEIITHYGDQRMPMQLRMLAEAVYGTGLMGQDGTQMRKLMVGMENGGPKDGSVASMMNVDMSQFR